MGIEIRMMPLFTVVALLIGARHTHAFYMPGIKPHTFAINEEVPLKVNAMTSIHTQLPKDYYKLPFCAPVGGPQMASENLGEFLTGNKIQSSPYVLNMMMEKYCQVLCQVQLSATEARNLRMYIKYGYHNNWIIDNLPSAVVGLSQTGMKQRHYAGGFPIGFLDSDTGEAYLYNHVNIIVDYHQVEPDVEGYRVVGFAVEPISINHEYANDFAWDGMSSEGYMKPLMGCMKYTNIHMTASRAMKKQVVRLGENIIYTYDVIWQSSDVRWASRWDIYMSEDHMVPAQVHWYSITNSILVTVFLSCLVVSVLVRNLRRDIMSYNSLADMTDQEKDDEIDESGWKLVHADVFRSPTYPMIYCVFVGTGLQLFVTAFLAIVFSALGFISPARRGSLMTALLVFYMMCGSLAGYVSSKLYKTFRGRQWQVCTVLTAVMYPGAMFTVFIVFNIVLAFLRSSGSVPFLDVLIVFGMWSCVSIPLVFLGAYFGYRGDAIAYPTITSTIARAIPEPSLVMNPKLNMYGAGMIPFAAAYVELFFIMTSLWMDQYYYVFGFTLIVFLILFVTCAEVTILLVYYQLCAENHRWWWFSFFCSGSTSLYIFVYSCIWFRQLEVSKLIITYMLYFGYMFLISFGMFLLTGMIGALSSLMFILKIFDSIKVD